MSLVNVQFTTDLPSPYDRTLDPIMIPSEYTYADLSEMLNQLLELQSPVYFDFAINNIMMVGALGEHVKKYNLTTERLLTVVYTLAIAPPQFVQAEKVDDWVAKLLYLYGQDYIVCACYDGSVQFLDIEVSPEKKLTRRKQLLVSKQPVTQLSYARSGTLFVAGYDGRVIHMDTSGAVLQEFTQNKSYIPVKQLSTIYIGQVELLATLNEENDINLFRTEPPRVATTAVTKNDVVRGPKNDLVLQQFQFDFIVNYFIQLTQYELLVAAMHSIYLFDMENKQAVRSFQATSPVNCFLTNYYTFLAGYQDRAVRLYDIRYQNPVVRTFKGHKSQVVSMRQRGAHCFSSCEIGGRVLVWDLRSDVPYHIIDCYDSGMDRRSDQSRVLDMVWCDRGYFVGGSARKVFWFE